MKEIKNAAAKLLSAVNGAITYSSLQGYINSIGFKLIEFNTNSGDDMLKALGILDETEGCDGRTIVTDEFNVIIIDGNLCISDKQRILLHEIGHILLHITNNSAFVDLTQIDREAEANAFVSEVYRLSQRNKIVIERCVWCLLLTVCIIITSVVLLSEKTENVKITPTITPPPTPAVQTVPETAVPSAPETNDNIVFVMPTGKVYHKSDCSYVNHLKAREITTAEAVKQGLRPCKRCNP